MPHSAKSTGSIRILIPLLTWLLTFDKVYSHTLSLLPAFCLLQVNGHCSSALVQVESRSAASVTRVVTMLPLLACLFGVLAVSVGLLQPALLLLV